MCVLCVCVLPFKLNMNKKNRNSNFLAKVWKKLFRLYGKNVHDDL